MILRLFQSCSFLFLRSSFKVSFDETHRESEENNTSEIEKAVRYANEFPDIVKIIAVGNEAMVHWASSYFVHPSVILKYVNYLQELKRMGKLSPEVWITSSDNFASWGGGDESYHIKELEELVQAVDYVSAHTYPFTTRITTVIFGRVLWKNRMDIPITIGYLWPCSVLLFMRKVNMKV